MKKPTTDDRSELNKTVGFFNAIQDDGLTENLDTYNADTVEWNVDVSFPVHQDGRSCTGGVMAFGKGSIQSLSTKQKINIRLLNLKSPDFPKGPGWEVRGAIKIIHNNNNLPNNNLTNNRRGKKAYHNSTLFQEAQDLTKIRHWQNIINRK